MVDILHMTDAIRKLHFTSEQNMGDFTLYFLGYDYDGISKLPSEEKAKARFNREGRHTAPSSRCHVYTL